MEKYAELTSAKVTAYYDKDMAHCVTAYGYCVEAYENATIDFTLGRTKEGLGQWLKYMKLGKDDTSTVALYK